MGNRLSPTATITATKNGANPTFNFAAVPEHPILVGTTWYCPYMDATDVTAVFKLATAASPAGPWTAGATIYQVSDVPWIGAATGIYAPHIVKVGTTYYMYYSAVVVGGAADAHNAIGLATASVITGPWTDSGTAVLPIGSAGTWDSRRVGEPSVIYDGVQWVMAYMGESDASPYTESEKVGVATATVPTGPWTKVTNNPVLDFGAAGAWDDSTVADPTIFIESGFYWIWYAGTPDSTPITKAEEGLAYATDVDGPWTKHASNPVLSVGAGGTWEDEQVFRGGVVKLDDVYHVTYGGFSGAAYQGGTAILNVTGTDTTGVGVWLDFARDGFGSGSSAGSGGLTRLMPQGGGATINDNITADTISYEITRGAQSEVTGGSASDSCTIVVQNDDGKYSPDNTASAYATLLRPGCPVWIGVNADGTTSGEGTVYGRFAGVVREIAPVPEAGATNTPTAEIVCDGILADLARTPVVVADSTARSQRTFRVAVLLAAGETILRMDLDDEPDPLPLSSADSTDASSVLDDLNRASGTRHYIRPSASLQQWYEYVTRNRNYKFGTAADTSVDAGSEHLVAAPGWRFNNDSIVNSQRASIDPISFTPATATVWSYEQVPFGLTGTRIIWADFDDYVSNAALSINTSSGSVTSTLTPFGRSAKIELWSAGATVTELSIEGSQVERDSAVTVSAEDASSQAAYRTRSGSDLSGELLGSQPSAQGIVDHIVYRYGARPLKRPSITIVNWLPDMFALDPYDLLGVTIGAVSAADLKFEIVGITERGVMTAATGVYHEIDFQLAESRIQGTQDWFTWDESVWDGPDLIAY